VIASGTICPTTHTRQGSDSRREPHQGMLHPPGSLDPSSCESTAVFFRNSVFSIQNPPEVFFFCRTSFFVYFSFGSSATRCSGLTISRSQGPLTALWPFTFPSERGEKKQARISKVLTPLCTPYRKRKAFFPNQAGLFRTLRTNPTLLARRILSPPFARLWRLFS